ncbi:hypothetical protein P153DRAFT_279234 [Dothidotthia symphoricarpi CBS 119687]|uniref:Uncharacterized protein n=1 Tax=Dothidotthia symphoricarpi CBS 119687 TaxID=1392245 RepID=A0A6A6ATA3_9PLEO|nr:uncharacterized protein P153DRAFT_279234 [Dothidotthia symphoricarpi CBS 119687]KAF2134453.1 hypothetical protein P153DRAFT_279234 [Dothidotthia symphoricarpi CBS 119687]
MATHEQPPAMLETHLTSPPMTPGIRSHARFPSQASNTSPLSSRMSALKFTHTPPLEFIEPTGQGHHFKFTRPQSFEPSSRLSTDSGRVYATTLQDSDDDDEDIIEIEIDDDDEDEIEIDDESEQDSDQEEETPMRRVEEADFILEELDSDSDCDCNIEVVQPDYFEDAKSEKSGKKLEVINKLKELILEETSSDEEARERIYRQKKKRWSAGVFKRTHSQSVEGDSSYSDNDPMDDVDPNARRLRRRVRGTFERRGSLTFEDRGFSNTNNILEVEEPEEGTVMHSKGPPSILSDDAFTLDELPFWRGSEDSMDVEFDSD